MDIILYKILYKIPCKILYKMSARNIRVKYPREMSTRNICAKVRAKESARKCAKSIRESRRVKAVMDGRHRHCYNY